MWRLCLGCLLVLPVMGVMGHEPRVPREVSVSRLSARPVATPTSIFCPPYESSPIFRPRANQIAATPANWVSVIESASDGDEILLADGVYTYTDYSTNVFSEITIRGASGNRDAVRIVGRGYDFGGEAIAIFSPNVTIADLTITDVRNHGVHIQEGSNGVHLYNLHIYDIGTQHVKGSGAGSADGIVACSSIGYSVGAVRGDYLNGIDLHGADSWVIRDNYIYNIWGDGTGCEVDVDCGTYYAGGGPAILLWDDARDNVVERNQIIDCYRGIAIGFETSHPGGLVRNNFFYQSVAQRPGANGPIPGDMGIQIDGGSGVLVDHNTVILGGDYPGSLEIFSSQNVLVRNNLLSTTIRSGQSSFTENGNLFNASVSDLVFPGQPYLQDGSQAVDYAQTVPGLADTDISGGARPQGARADAGCDEYDPVVIISDGFESGSLVLWS